MRRVCSNSSGVWTSTSRTADRTCRCRYCIGQIDVLLVGGLRVLVIFLRVLGVWWLVVRRVLRVVGWFLLIIFRWIDFVAFSGVCFLCSITLYPIGYLLSTSLCNYISFFLLFYFVFPVLLACVQYLLINFY